MAQDHAKYLVSIVLYASESQVYSPVSTLWHFKVLVKFSALIAPTFTGSCRPLRLTAPTLTLFLFLGSIFPECSCPIRSSLLADSGIWVIFYAADCLEHHVSFNDPSPPRSAAAPARRTGLNLPSQKHLIYRLCFLRVHQAPATHLFTHPFFNTSTLATVKQQLFPNLHHWYDTALQWNAPPEFALDRSTWNNLLSHHELNI